MNLKYSELRMAFDFVSSRDQGENIAYVGRDDGEFYYYSQVLGLDETRGKDVHSSNFESVPHRDILNLGRELAFDFIDERLAEQYAVVREYFAEEDTAESRFSDMLQSHGLLQDWNEYKAEKVEKTLREWCTQKQIELDD
ncbi:MAG: hypothetical protein ISR54_05850 [Chlorobium phaeobacteroides]|uniref:Uncharacterized protein n=1 Tax=Chlorobium phaeobacteroides (strain BS1) TaxID=331678 RepID=B3EJP0_CHLPB|nr:hypothetical protein [Chlorobium phaeobacteroides]MBL6956327.1 hypothetical protein [Chlorobium phaeobacteroides]NEX14252.1 hypothetical protein [Prosthecochloris sp.]